MSESAPPANRRPARAARARLGLGDAVALALATAAGAGLSPVAPGTAGTLVAIPLALAVSRLGPAGQCAAILGAVALALAAASRAARRFGHHDDRRIVSDEVAGFLVATALVPPSLLTYAAAFLLFRLFDILKPWPVSFFDRRVRNCFGNVLDDVAAGLYTRACLAALLALA